MTIRLPYTHGRHGEHGGHGRLHRLLQYETDKNVWSRGILLCISLFHNNYAAKYVSFQLKNAAVLLHWIRFLKKLDTYIYFFIIYGDFQV